MHSFVFSSYLPFLQTEGAEVLQTDESLEARELKERV